MPNFNVKAPDQNAYDDDIEEIAALRGEVRQLKALIEQLQKTLAARAAQEKNTK